MRVVFEGTPEQVLRDMQEYIARMGMLFGDAEDKPERVTAEIIQPQSCVVPAQIEAPMIVTSVKKESRMQTCKHCHKSFERLPRHEPHCKENPERKPVLNSGKRGPRKTQDDPIVKKYLKGEYDGN